MNSKQKMILNQVMSYIDCRYKNNVVSEEDLSKFVNFYADCPLSEPLSETEKNEVINELLSRLRVRMDVGSVIKKKEHKPWYMNSKESNGSEYWDRYRDYLIREEEFPIETVNAIDRSTDSIMDLLGNPKSDYGFFNKGLVIGDVQSGKTSTYTALINKAADAGYQIIILLTGTIEKLRQQTQSRIDEGFVGLDSYGHANKKLDSKVGVGKINGSFSACSLTTTMADFNQATAKAFNIELQNLSSPVIFVLKKNKSVLEKLEEWLKYYNADGVNRKIDTPMLLIDDEADNASVNTSKEDESPSTINACIRKLLHVFTHSTYVAFTATPYANIFIDPDTDDEMLNDDLFPEDFIYVLDTPTNYIGAKSVFMEDGEYNFIVNNNDDCEEFLPEKHKKGFEPNELPLSLKEAICAFFITNVIRDLRGQEGTHRSMLINISRFIDVQHEVAKKVDEFVRDFRTEYKSYGKSGKKAEKHSAISFTKNVYEKYYVNLKAGKKGDIFDWETIQPNLSKSCSSIVVKTVNATNSKKNLNYDDYKGQGLRIIAVGGFSLSRGLTLEGLSTSYFYRNSKMYDTLMQMGRWFGYRKGYDDLCKLWMSDRSFDWYEYITEASEDLKHEVKKMMNANSTPRDFGLGVRNDVVSLMVTAVNKMRSAGDYSRAISLCGTVIETRYLDLDETIQKENNSVIYEWIDKLLLDGYQFTTVKKVDGLDEELDQKRHKQMLSIPKEYIIELLTKFNINVFNFDFESNSIINSIKDEKNEQFNYWDLIIADNSQNKEEKIASNLSLGPIGRSFTINEEKKYIQMSGTKSRLGSVNYAKGGLTDAEVKIIQSRADKNKSSTEKKNYNQNDYFNTGYKRNPLLIIYPVLLTENKKEIEHQELIEPYKNLVYGIALGFPDIDGKGKVVQNYKINKIKMKEILGVEDDDFDEELENEND